MVVKCECSLKSEALHCNERGSSHIAEVLIAIPAEQILGGFLPGLRHENTPGESASPRPP